MTSFRGAWEALAFWSLSYRPSSGRRDRLRPRLQSNPDCNSVLDRPHISCQASKDVSSCGMRTSCLLRPKPTVLTLKFRAPNHELGCRIPPIGARYSIQHASGLVMPHRTCDIPLSHTLCDKPLSCGWSVYNEASMPCYKPCAELQNNNDSLRKLVEPGLTRVSTYHNVPVVRTHM